MISLHESTRHFYFYTASARSGPSVSTEHRHFLRTSNDIGVGDQAQASGRIAIKWIMGIKSVRTMRRASVNPVHLKFSSDSEYQFVGSGQPPLVELS